MPRRVIKINSIKLVPCIISLVLVFVFVSLGIMTEEVYAESDFSNSIQGQGDGLRGEYYGNMNFTDIKDIRIDKTINFQWGESSLSVNIDSDSFSVIWLGEVQPRYSELYTFYINTDECVKLWLNDLLLINSSVDNTVMEHSGTIELVAGGKYAIRIEYFKNTPNSIIELRWSSDSQAKEVIPKTQLYSPKIFTAMEHNCRTADNTFAVGDFVPLKLKFKIMQNEIENPVIAIDMNIRKQDGTISEFILKEIKTGTGINKNMFNVYVNNSIIDKEYYSVWIEGTGSSRRLKIRVSRSFGQNDVLQISYNVKVTASSSGFDMGIQNYIDANVLMSIYYEIVERVDLGLKLTNVYSIDSTLNTSEKQKFKADIRLEDSIILE